MSMDSNRNSQHGSLPPAGQPQPRIDQPREEPLRLAPGQDEDDVIPFRLPTAPAPAQESDDTRMDSGPGTLKHGASADALRWALDAMHHPALAAADWLALDIDPDAADAAGLLCNPRITMMQVRQAKAVFKTMRIVGEKSADRRVGARLYAAAIAAGLVRHKKKITTQSDAALKRAFQALLDDRRMPQSIRDLAGMGLCALDERRYDSTGRASA
jgi:hypothetical protein